MRPTVLSGYSDYRTFEVCCKRRGILQLDNQGELLQLFQSFLLVSALEVIKPKQLCYMYLQAGFYLSFSLLKLSWNITRKQWQFSTTSCPPLSNFGVSWGFFVLNFLPLRCLQLLSKYIKIMIMVITGDVKIVFRLDPDVWLQSFPFSSLHCQHSVHVNVIEYDWHYWQTVTVNKKNNQPL